MSKKSKIVEAAVAGSGAGTIGHASYSGRDIEAAMTAAIKDCHAKGITDHVEVKAAMMAARKRAKGV